MENNENSARCTCELKDGVIAVHFKRELADPEDLAREPLLYMYRIIGVAIDADTGKRMVSSRERRRRMQIPKSVAEKAAGAKAAGRKTGDIKQRKKQATEIRLMGG